MSCLYICNMDEIRNKIKESGLISLDMEDLISKEPYLEIDISQQLWQGMVLKEKEFRSWIKSHDWKQYQGKLVRIFCATDAIVPTWAYMLVTSALLPYTSYVITGSKVEMEQFLIRKSLSELNLEALKDKKVIVKGCAKLLSQEYALTQLVLTLQPIVVSLMFGEPCSTVPIFKRSTKV